MGASKDEATESISGHEWDEEPDDVRPVSLADADDSELADEFYRRLKNMEYELCLSVKAEIDRELERRNARSQFKEEV